MPSPSDRQENLHNLSQIAKLEITDYCLFNVWNGVRSILIGILYSKCCKYDQTTLKAVSLPFLNPSNVRFASNQVNSSCGKSHKVTKESTSKWNHLICYSRFCWEDYDSNHYGKNGQITRHCKNHVMPVYILILSTLYNCVDAYFYFYHSSCNWKVIR